MIVAVPELMFSVPLAEVLLLPSTNPVSAPTVNVPLLLWSLAPTLRTLVLRLLAMMELGLVPAVVPLMVSEPSLDRVSVELVPLPIVANP